VNGPDIVENALPYIANLETRPVETVDLVVVHCTELPDLATARDYGKKIHHANSGTGNSGHFYIERNGSIEQWVPIERVAHHVRGSNPRSIGIELVNNGRFPDWHDSRKQAMTEPYPPLQIESLIRLLLHLENELGNLVWIAGHEDLDVSSVAATDNPELLVRRKLDPGPFFPWSKILAETGLKRLLPGSSSGSAGL
jgi:N-acetylmuramoyl-L-alanine amidase